MLTFFRRIRKGLLSDGATSKYLFYAIGEIALVVIGILIALQINNWNEWRKERVIQLRLLNELHTTVSEDLNSNKFKVNINAESLSSIEMLISHLEKKLPYHDSLSNHFGMAHSRLISQIKDNAYENIKAYGLDFIKNDTTKNRITHSYENRFQFLDILNERFDEFYYHVAAPVLVNSFERMNPQGVRVPMIPFNYDSLISNNKYLTILKSTQIHLQQYLGWQKSCVLHDLNEMLIRLETEIAQR